MMARRQGGGDEGVLNQYVEEADDEANAASALKWKRKGTTTGIKPGKVDK